MNKLHTENYGGNLHATAVAINKLGLADYVLAMSSSGGNTVVVFRMPARMVYRVRESQSSYVGDPHHDDPDPVKGMKHLKVGDKVYYQPDHYRLPDEDKWENGIVKEIPDNNDESVRVVYNCGGDWDNYRNYTAAMTNLRDLYPGWKS